MDIRELVHLAERRELRAQQLRTRRANFEVVPNVRSSSEAREIVSGARLIAICVYDRRLGLGTWKGAPGTARVQWRAPDSRRLGPTRRLRVEKILV